MGRSSRPRPPVVFTFVHDVREAVVSVVVIVGDAAAVAVTSTCYIFASFTKIVEHNACL